VLTGGKPNEICVRVRADREQIGERACVTVTPESL
jgi:hypothetical protein